MIGLLSAITRSAILDGAQAYIVNSSGQSQTASIEGHPELKVGPLPRRTGSTSIAAGVKAKVLASTRTLRARNPSVWATISTRAITPGFG